MADAAPRAVPVHRDGHPIRKGGGDGGQSQLRGPQGGGQSRDHRHRGRGHGRHAGPPHRQALPGGIFCRRRVRGNPCLRLPPGERRGYGAGADDDFVLRPDLSTLRQLPWLEGTALVLADVLDHHRHELAHSPRAVLKAQLERLDALRMRAFLASELEFYLFDETYESALAKRYAGLNTAGHYIEDYHVLQTTKEEG